MRALKFTPIIEVKHDKITWESEKSAKLVEKKILNFA